MTDPGTAPRLHRVAVLFALTLSILLAAPAVQAGPATDQLRNRVDRILQVLSDPEMAKESRTVERPAARRRLAGGFSTFNETPGRALAPNGQPRPPAERGELVRLFPIL